MENNLKNSIEFLNYSVGKQHGFVVPKNYFNELENEIETRNIISNLPNKNGLNIPEKYFEELESELLERVAEVDLPKKNSLGVPKGYFDSLEDTILGKIKVEDENIKETKVVSLSQRIHKLIPMAAAASVLLLVGTYFFKIPSRPPNIQIEETEIVSWFESGFGETNSYELATLFSTDDLNYDDFTVNVSNDKIEDYLNTIDTSTLIEYDEIELINNNEL
ncbi:hypothetical protein ACOSP6_06515 [Tenacibaculum sp. MEBiC06402]|uniref:hypothetical protein n=1 Tax=unclassified Tenacibaculum TaxID=2635139 RepID=UPI003B9AAF35